MKRFTFHLSPFTFHHLSFILPLMIALEMITNFPSSPGIYLMKTSEGTVLYVGKARNL